MNASDLNISISPAQARGLVFNWSAWISSAHEDANSAWQADCGNLAAKVFEQDVLQPAAWGSLWPRWRSEWQTSSPESVSKEAEATFHYIDKLKMEDNLVSKDEFAVAFDLAATELSIFPFCVSLHERFWNSSQAWASSAGTDEQLNRSRWSSLWSVYAPPLDFSKPSSSAAFHFLDADADGEITRSEFESVFGLCHNTPTSSTASGSATSTTATSSSAPTTSTQTSSSGVSSTSSSTSSGSSTWGTVVPVVPATTTAPRAGACCYEVSAQCLSCIAGITVEELCSRDSMSLTPGCQGAPAKAEAAPGGPHANAHLSTTLPAHFEKVGSSDHTGCPITGLAFSPLLSGFKESQEDEMGECQARCRQSIGCGFFTFWRTSKRCQLHPVTAKCSADLEAIGGPPQCTAEFKARIASVDFGLLSKMQLTNLHASLPHTLAEHWGVKPSQVADVEGKPGSVTLLPGSLLVEGKVILPAGLAVDDLAKKSDHGASLQLREKVSKLLLSMNVPYEPDRSKNFEAGFPLTVDIAAKHGCFLDHLQYSSPEQENVMADSAEDCQRNCSVSGVCSVFTFFAKDRQCLLAGGEIVPQRNQEALSGPAQCPSIPQARGWAEELPGEVVAESKAAVEVARQVPLVYYMILAALILLALLVCGILRCCKKPKGRGKKSKWHNQALYMPVADDDPGAHEVDRTAMAAESPGAAEEDFGFHGPEKLSWRLPPQG